MSNDSNPAWTPAAQRGHVPRGARGFQGDQAGIVTRVSAAVVDAVVVGVVLLVLWGVLTAALFVVHPIRFHVPAPSYGQVVGAGLVVTFGYLSASWTAAGRTYGDQLLGLRVLDYDGGTVNWPIALIRALLCVVFPFGLLWVLVDPSNRSVQDIVLRTSVIYDWRQHLPERAR